MSKATTPQPPRPPGRKMYGLSTWIALLFLLPAGAAATYFGRNWNATRLQTAKLEAEFQTLQSSNAVLSQAFEVLENRKFQFCNRSQDTITIDWVTVAYQDGQQLRVFDSARCSAWREVVLAAGDNRTLTLTSTQEGCNWDGRVVYFALRFTRESAEFKRRYNWVAHYSGFDRDCFTQE